MNITNYKLKTEDNFIIDAVAHYPNIEPKITIIMCHGCTSFKDGRNLEMLKLAEKLCQNGFKVVRFDFRGHGKSSGEQIDVNLESFIKDLDCVIKNLDDDLPIYLFGFSFGGLAVANYIYRKKMNVDKVVLWSPSLNPWEGSFNNKNCFCYQEIHDGIVDNSLEKNGYIVLKTKNFKVSKLFINQCKNFNYLETIKFLPRNTLILQAINDRNVDKEYNEKIAKEFNIKYKEVDASHSLKEKIDEAINDTVIYFNN